MRTIRSSALAAALLAASLVALGALHAEQQAQVQPDARFDRVAAVVDEQMKTLRVPGVVVGVLADGATRTRAFGVTNTDHPLDVTDETLFQIGSISKTFTGTAIVRLVEQQKLRLDDPVRKHLPNFRVKDPEASARVTVRDTLTHMSGWEGDLFEDPSSGDDALERIVERMADLEQTAAVGEMWGYNNSGFYVAGRIVEVVTGKPFERALRELVLDPIGIDRAYFFPADVMTRRFAVGHGVRDGKLGVLVPWPIPRAANAAGGITTDVASMLRYAAFHMGDGTSAGGAPVLPTAALRGMRTAVVEKAGTDLTMGLTWHLSTRGGVTLAEHSGGTIGQASRLLIAPERQFALAIVTNSNRGSSLITQATRAAMDAYLGLPHVPPSRIAVDAAALAEYAGTYRRQYQDVKVSVDGDALKVETMPKMRGLDGQLPPAPPAQRVGFHARDRLLQLTGPNAGEPAGEFVRDANGRVAWLRTGRNHRRIAEPSTH